MRKSFLENVQEKGFKSAFSEMSKSFEEIQAFEGLGGIQEDNWKPEKFFRYALFREGGLDPTKNVGRAFLGYVHAFEKKKALDQALPALEIYEQSLSDK